VPLSSNRFLESLPLAPDRVWLGYVVAFVFSLAALGVRIVLDPVFPAGFPFLTFFPVVIMTSFLFGWAPGLFSGLLCGLLSWYFFIPPFNSFALQSGTALALGFYVAVVTVDILLVHWMQRANRRLRSERLRSQQLADQAELLFHELQHRVSNNLQMIGAVLSLQRRDITDPPARQALGDAVAKLQTIGRIQRQLYTADNADLSLAGFLPSLVADLVAAGGQPGITHRVEVAEDIEIAPGTAIPLALVVAEAVANAVEHGFADRSSGHVAVLVAREAGHIDLRIVNDGVPLPDGFDDKTSNSLGLRIARTLADQLSGSFSLARGDGGVTVARIRFPLGRTAAK
jgi:two-component sensor histidine kinase